MNLEKDIIEHRVDKDCYGDDDDGNDDGNDDDNDDGNDDVNDDVNDDDSDDVNDDDMARCLHNMQRPNCQLRKLVLQRRG